MHTEYLQKTVIIFSIDFLHCYCGTLNGGNDSEIVFKGIKSLIIYKDIYMQDRAMLIQLGYTPNEALVEQLERIKKNTVGYEKIDKHIMDLNDHLKVNNAYVALSNSKDYFKIKIESPTPQLAQEAHEKIKHFSEKFKVEVEKLPNKETYYIIGYHH